MWPPFSPAVFSGPARLGFQRSRIKRSRTNFLALDSRIAYYATGPIAFQGLIRERRRVESRQSAAL